MIDRPQGTAGAWTTHSGQSPGTTIIYYRQGHPEVKRQGKPAYSAMSIVGGCGCRRSQGPRCALARSTQ